ncbi:extracellular solute-binding protein [Erwinia endophytica]|uniref:ABC transporter substrate-binding protein n=1 Tax=Erwinia endophytica TaxID=1563158 RepID=UPI001265FB35|nr:extracellular solute-binding protein [Erwinia endophytica]KAB8308022.1 extracellular solute-binding protein [Erwinia endophytica]
MKRIKTRVITSRLASGILASLIYLVSSESASQAAENLNGKSITVLLPSPGYPAAEIKKFEAQTGINVDQQTLAWDQLRTRIVTALVAGTSPADVIELDWSWVGQFGAAAWLTPLDGSLNADLLKHIAITPIFKYQGKLLGAPYNNDFKMLVYNKAQLTKAGIQHPPTTLDELLADGKALKDKAGVKYPFGLPLSVGEATSTAWFLLTMMYNGEVFTNQLKPAFTRKDSAGYKALSFIKQALDAGLIDPAATNYGNEEVRAMFKSGDVSMILSDGPGPLSTYNDKTQSKIAGNAFAAVVPNITGTSKTYGLPEALAIPHASTQKAAAEAFINWMIDPQHQVPIYIAAGTLPTSTPALITLNKAEKLQSGDAILQQIGGIGPLFAAGTPSWYPAFSSGAASAINAMAKGQLSVDEAAKAIADAANSAMAGE